MALSLADQRRLRAAIRVVHMANVQVSEIKSDRGKLDDAFEALGQTYRLLLDAEAKLNR